MKMQITKIDHIGIVVKDIQKTVEYYSSTLGIGPFRVFEVNIPDAIVQGKVSSLRIKAAIAKLGSLDIELIESIEGENIYAEFLKSRGEGLHHLAMLVDDVDKEVAELKEQGIRVLQGAKTPAGSFAYLDTEEIGGVIIELLPKARP